MVTLDIGVQKFRQFTDRNIYSQTGRELSKSRRTSRNTLQPKPIYVKVTKIGSSAGVFFFFLILNQFQIFGPRIFSGTIIATILQFGILSRLYLWWFLLGGVTLEANLVAIKSFIVFAMRTSAQMVFSSFFNPLVPGVH